MTTRTRLVLGSALVLFLELALIRWLGSNIVHLSYFTNVGLLGSFLGVGLGFLLSRREASTLPWSPAVLGGLVLFVEVAPVRIDRGGGTLVYFTSLHTSGPPPYVVLPLVFV